MKKAQTILLPIDPEIAEEISKSSDLDREDIATLLSLWLKRRKKERVEDFFKTVEAIASKAHERGLTEESFKNILAHI
jgi:hypothetical protein